VEATDLQSAVDQIIAPAQEETGETNQVEAEQAVVEPEAEEVEVEAFEGTEELDELEASEEDYEDAEIQTEDEVEATEENNLIPVKIDGKEEHWTMDQLKQSAAGQGAISNRFQEIAQIRKRLEDQEVGLAQREQQIAQMYSQSQQGFMSQPQLPDHTLAESDPISYMEQRAKYDADMQSYQQQHMQMQQIQHQQKQQADQQHQSFVTEQAEIIRGKIPELADPAKSKTHWQSLMGSAKEYGFSDEEIAATADARYIQMANDAMKFRRIVANRKKAEAKGKNAKPVVKAGAKKVADPVNSSRRKQQQKLQKSGRIEDAIDLMMNPQG
jgi:hypothetical protein